LGECGDELAAAGVADLDGVGLSAPVGGDGKEIARVAG
jgi:hypothetical protein